MVADWKSLVAIGVTVLGLILAAGRWVGQMEQRIVTLEQQQHYLHGDVSVPGR